MREASQFQKIINIVNGYSGKEPLHRYLKNYFNAHREMGSGDRKLYTHFIFNYYRIGKLLPALSIEERITVGNYLCTAPPPPEGGNSYDPFYSLIHYCLSKYLQLTAIDLLDSIEEKTGRIKSVYPDFKVQDIYPFSDRLPGAIDKEAFILSHLRQPKLWIRVRKKFLNEVEKELVKENIPFNRSEESPLTFSFVNSTKLDKLKSYEKGYFEIQDWSSQQTVNYFQPDANERWWDACAGSGGKSLLLYDAEPTVHIVVSDSRESILRNLKERFRKARIRSYETLLADLTISDFGFRPSADGSDLFDGVIADVPCSGSGTWSRNPEWLTFFDEKLIQRHTETQKKMVSNMIPLLKVNGPFIYITCSVFKEENEEVVEFLQKQLHLELIESAYLKGYERGGDTMFVARLKK